MARILQFPNGKVRKTARKSASQNIDRSLDFQRKSYDLAMGALSYFENFRVSFETLELLHKGISMIYRERRQFERER